MSETPDLRVAGESPFFVDGLDLSVLREYEKAERTCDRCGVTSRDVHVYHWCVPIDGPSPGCANWCAECAHKES